LVALLPKQIADSAFAVDLRGTPTVVLYCMGTAALLTSPPAMYALKLVLDLIEPLNLYIHLCLFNLNYPANLQDFVS
jgi:hypothetical protein